jgi:hypothetical protein
MEPLALLTPKVERRMQTHLLSHRTGAFKIIQAPYRQEYQHITLILFRGQPTEN